MDAILMDLPRIIIGFIGSAVFAVVVTVSIAKICER